MTTVPHRLLLIAFLLLPLQAFVPVAGAGQAVPPPVELDTLRVRAVSRLSPVLNSPGRAVQVIDREAIQASPVQSVSALLYWALGTDVGARSPAQADLSIRGSSFEGVVVLVDGVRMNDPQTGHFNLDLAVPLDRVERVEILRGPASGVYGADAVGGVVNVVTRRDRAGWIGRLEGGSFGTARAAWDGATTLESGETFGLAGEWSRGDGHREGTDFDMLQLSGRGSAPLGRGVLDLDGGYASRDFGAQDFYAPYPSYEETRTSTASLSWTPDARAGWGVRPQFSWRRHDDDFTLIRDQPEVYRNRHRSSQMGGELVASRNWGGGGALLLGGEGYRDDLESNNLGDRQQYRAAVFAEGAVGAMDRASLRVSVRGDWYETFGSVFSPGISGAWNLTPAFQLRGGLGRSFRTPTWTERFYEDPVNIGNPDLEPESAWTYEAGLRWTLGAAGTLDLGGFLRESRDLIDWARLPGTDEPWRTRNVESADFRGLEGTVSLQGLGGLWSAGGYFLDVETSDLEGFESKTALRPVREQITLAADYPLGDQAALRAQVLRSRREGDPAYWRVDLRASTDAGRFRLYLDARNLLDEEYLDILGMVAPGRSFTVGVSVGSGTPGTR